MPKNQTWYETFQGLVNEPETMDTTEITTHNLNLSFFRLVIFKSSVRITCINSTHAVGKEPRRELVQKILYSHLLRVLLHLARLPYNKTGSAATTEVCI